MIARKCFVSGRVQGVFYRATVARRAAELGVTGHARNLADGRVEVLACGRRASVERFIEVLWEGSSASRVRAVDVQEVELAAAQWPGDFGTG
ncbi:MAG: acylphosphatase [Steroidobacteraceae bacterium]|nr:acylphosphatase [Steroidobacteraceae bacterium]MCW5573791.1 acylphosphatase [Steroidobacteraceae bacterium]